MPARQQGHDGVADYLVLAHYQLAQLRFHLPRRHRECLGGHLRTAHGPGAGLFGTGLFGTGPAGARRAGPGRAGPIRYRVVRNGAV